jgi:hypothetical protein
MYYLHPNKALRSNSTCVRYIKNLLAQHLGGGPLIFGTGEEKMLALSGFYPEDWSAVNFLTWILYRRKKGWLDLPPIAAAPVVNESTFVGSPYGREGIDVYFDFLELKTQVVREITAFYHKTRPNVVVVFLGGREFEAAATTDVASQTLAVRKITPSPHTPEGAATLKYSHALVFKIPQSPREFALLSRQVADLLKTAAHLPPVEKKPVKVQKKELYLLHGGVEVEDGVVLDNDVYVYI